uniref:HTH myb-type domain-containing protein n=1 Tax=Syphacia muris TaxID=451379 RepID=A0A0N5AK43_9BILA
MSGDYDPLVKPERKCECNLNRIIFTFFAMCRNLSDEEILGSEYDYRTVDWSKIATYDFLDTRSATQLRLKWNNEQSPKWSKAEWNSQELKKLQSLATGPWVRWGIVARLLGTGRTPFQCFLKYKLECDKEAKLTWSKEEDTSLITLCHSLKINGKIPWEKVCCYMEGRSRQQCKVRYDRTLNVELKYGRWNEEEDILLKCAVGRFGKNWKQVASCVPGRTDAQCRDRWVNILDEKIKDSPWTLEEDEKLLKGVKEIGKEWARIALMLPGRTGDHCKTRFRSLMVSKVKVNFICLYS